MSTDETGSPPLVPSRDDAKDYEKPIPKTPTAATEPMGYEKPFAKSSSTSEGYEKLDPKTLVKRGDYEKPLPKETKSEGPEYEQPLPKPRGKSQTEETPGNDYEEVKAPNDKNELSNEYEVVKPPTEAELNPKPLARRQSQDKTKSTLPDTLKTPPADSPSGSSTGSTPKPKVKPKPAHLLKPKPPVAKKPSKEATPTSSPPVDKKEDESTAPKPKPRPQKPSPPPRNSSLPSTPQGSPSPTPKQVQPSPLTASTSPVPPKSPLSPPPTQAPPTTPPLATPTKVERKSSFPPRPKPPPVRKPSTKTSSVEDTDGDNKKVTSPVSNGPTTPNEKKPVKQDYPVPTARRRSREGSVKGPIPSRPPPPRVTKKDPEETKEEPDGQKYYKALKSFTGAGGNGDQLSFKEGDILILMNDGNASSSAKDGWVHGMLDDGTTGLFPLSHVIDFQPQ